MTKPELDLSIEVPGTPEEVWKVIATGEGIGSWFVPAEIDVEAGQILYDFGSYGKQPARIVERVPGERVVFQGGGQFPLTDVWTVEASSGDTCTVRLVSSGFENIEDWYDDFDGFANGWRIFMNNMRLHCTHFAGQAARAIVPTATTAGPNAVAWKAFTTALGIPQTFAPGDRLVTTDPDLPPVAGVVDSFVSTEKVTVATFLLDEPTPGTAFIAAEGSGDQIAVSIYLYMYGPAAATVEDRWTPWLREHFSPVDESPADS